MYVGCEAWKYRQILISHGAIRKHKNIILGHQSNITIKEARALGYYSVERLMEHLYNHVECFAHYHKYWKTLLSSRSTLVTTVDIPLIR